MNFCYIFKVETYIFLDLDHSDCVPYSESACKAAAENLKLKFTVGDYTIKGCYMYNNGKYPGDIWYGTGGSEKQIRVLPFASKNIERPIGFDCKSGNSQWVLTLY